MAATFDFMLKPYDPAHLRAAAKGRVLVVGLGGGADVVFATAIAEFLRSAPAAAGGAAAVVHTANTKGGTPTDREVLTEAMESCPDILRLPPDVVPVDPAVPTYGSTAVEQSMPRFAGGSPYVVCLPSTSKDVAECTAQNCAALVPQLQRLAFDVVIGCDAGGDGLTGGVDFEGDVELGRDIQMTKVLRSCGVPFIHIVVGPGCDGESTEEQMLAAMAKARPPRFHPAVPAPHAFRCRSRPARVCPCLPVSALLESLRTLCSALSAHAGPLPLNPS